MIVRFVVLAAVICFGNLAQAEVLLNIPASACTPDAATIRFNRHVTANGSVRHAGNNVDKITLICSVTSFDTATTDWTLLLKYVDSTGPTPTAFVRAQLFQLPEGGPTCPFP
jgi:hypothetical protein